MWPAPPRGAYAAPTPATRAASCSENSFVMRFTTIDAPVSISDASRPLMSTVAWM